MGTSRSKPRAVSSHRLGKLAKVYTAISGKRCIIQAKDVPHYEHERYTVALQPIGLYIIDAPASTKELCQAIR
jgi:hypothetical protein